MPRKRKATIAETTTAPTPSTSINNLSPEVLDLVLDQICNDERLDDDEIIWVLGKCRRLSRLFNSLATPRVFKEIHFHCFGWTYRDHSKGDAAATRHSKKFMLLLEANPTLASHARTVEITSRTGSRSWFGRSKTLPLIFPQLVNVQRLCIEVYNGSMWWEKLHADVAKAFQDAFLLPSLKTLEVMNIHGLPLDPLLVSAPKIAPKPAPAPKPVPAPQKTQTVGTRRSTRIKEATKSSASIDSVSLASPPVPPPAQACGIDSLILCAGTLQFSALNPSATGATKKASPYTIKKLKVNFKTECFSFNSRGFASLSTSWVKLVTKLGTSLKEVEINDKQGTHNPEHWPTGDYLSGLTCIEALTMFADVSPAQYNTYKFDFPKGFVRALKSQKPVTSLQSICLIFSMSVWMHTCTKWVLSQGWDAISELLVAIAPQLQTLTLQFQLGNFITAGDKDPVKTLDDMKKHFHDVLSGVKTALPSVVVKVVIVDECDFVV